MDKLDELLFSSLNKVEIFFDLRSSALALRPVIRVEFAALPTNESEAILERVNQWKTTLSNEINKLIIYYEPPRTVDCKSIAIWIARELQLSGKEVILTERKAFTHTPVDFSPESNSGVSVNI